MHNKVLGERVKAARLEKKMTQKEVAGDFITRNMLSKIENGSAYPSIKTIEYLSKVLSKPVGYFMESMVDGSYSETAVVNLKNAWEMYNNKKYDECINEITGQLSKFRQHNMQNKEECYNLLSRAYYYLGILYTKEKDYKKSARFFMEALRYHDALIFKNDAYRLDILFELGLNAIKTENLNSAGYFLANMSESLKSEDKMKKARLLDMEVSLLKKDYDKAIETAKENNMTFNDPALQSRYCILLCKAYFASGKSTEAIQKLKNEIEKLKDSKNTVVLSAMYELLANSYSAVEDYKNAFKYMQLSKQV